MDYLYLNAIVKEVYKDLPCGCPFPAEFSKSLYATVSGLDCLSNPDVPSVLSFFTLRAKGQASAMVFSKIQKHTNSASVGRFIQSVGWTWNGDLLFRNLDTILDVGFFSEEEINDTALRGGSFALPKNRRSTYTEIPMEFSPQVKQAILTTVLLRWLRFEAPLRIAVPKDVDYDSYVLSAMKKIYSLFPASLRAKAGFCSYLPSDKNLPETISIGFVPEEMADSRTLCLDGSSAAACAKLNCGTNSATLDTFIKYIANVPENVLPAFFEEMYEDLEGSGSNEKMVLVSPRDYQAIGMALNLLTLDGPLNELVAQWNSKFFNHKERDKISPRWQARIRDNIRKTINPAEFCRLAERRLSTEAFDGLKAYQEYCTGNPELAAALWDTTIAQQLARKKSYTDIYAHVSKRKTELSFVMDDEKLDQLFRLSVNEQLTALQEKPAQDLKSVRNLTGEARQLLTYAGSREIPDSSELKQGVEQFLAHLQDQDNRLLLDMMTNGFRQRQQQPHEDNLDKIRAQMDDMAAYRQKVAAHAAVPGAEQLLAEMDLFTGELNDRKNELIHAGLVQNFEVIAAKPAQTVDQIESVIAQAKALLAEVSSAAPIPQNAELLAALQSFVAEKESLINSSNVKFQEIARILNDRELPYFGVLEALNRADKSQLEDHHRQKISDVLAQRCTGSLEVYERDFERFYRKPLILANLAALPSYVFGIVAGDICRLGRICLTCGENCKAGETADKIAGALAVAQRISDNFHVDVSYNGNTLDPVWFKDLLRLAHTSRTMGDARQLEIVFYELADAGTFSGSELIPALEMLNRCNLQFGKLFKLILRGRFQDSTEQQYRNAFEMILQNSDKNRLELLEDMAQFAKKDKAESDSAAYRAFQRFYHDQQNQNSGNAGSCKKLIPVICGLGVVILALIVAVVLLLLSKPTEAPAPTTVPTVATTAPIETEPPVVYPESFEFYQSNLDGISRLCGGDQSVGFDARSQKVAALLDAADEETAAQILKCYSNSHGAEVKIDEQENTVSWDEYFFWLCWYYADQDISLFQSALQTTAPDEAVLSMLRIIHHDQSCQALVSEEAVEETVPAETVSEVTAAAETEETAAAADSTAEQTTEQTAEATTDVADAAETEETAAEPAESVPAETEAPITVGDVKATITDAAATCYEAALPYVERLHLVQKLFGENFQIDFALHSDTVAALNITADEKAPAYKQFMKHYSMFPGDFVLSFVENGVTVTWNEYVFWEYWVLAQRGADIASADAFNNDLHADVAEILSVVHHLVSEEEYPSNLDDALINGEQTTDSNEAELSVMEEIIQDAKAAFEKVQSIYNFIFEQVKEQ